MQMESREFKVKLEFKERQGLKGLPAFKGSKEELELMARRVFKVSLVLKESKGLQAFKG